MNSIDSGPCPPGSPSIAAFTNGDEEGYLAVTSAGAVYQNGVPAPGTNGHPLVAPIVGVTELTAPSGSGYALAARDGGVFSFGQVPFAGSMGGHSLNAPIVGIAGYGSDGGYWLVASDGGVFAFGGAPFLGSMAGQHLNAPIVGMTSYGGGYELVAADGGVFAFGGAGFYGSMAGQHLNAPIVGIASVGEPNGGGYFLAGADGGIFAFGTASFSFGGSAVGFSHSPVIAFSATTGPDEFPPEPIYWTQELATLSGDLFSL